MCSNRLKKGRRYFNHEMVETIFLESDYEIIDGPLKLIPVRTGTVRLTFKYMGKSER